MKAITVSSKALILVVAIGVAGAAVAGCNTIEGIGQDVSAAGKGISKGAQSTKKKP